MLLLLLVWLLAARQRVNIAPLQAVLPKLLRSFYYIFKSIIILYATRVANIILL